MSAQLQFAEPPQIRDWLPEFYYRQSEWVSRSELYRLADSVAMFLFREPPLQEFRGEALKSAGLGSLVHMGVLEFGVFKAKVIPFAKTNRRGSSSVADEDLPVSTDDVDPPLDYCAMLSDRVEKAAAADLEQRPLTKEEIKAAKEAATAEKKRVAAEKKAANEAKKAAKAAKEAEIAALLKRADAEDLWLVPPQDIERAQKILDSIWANPRAAAYLRGDVVLHGQACIAVHTEIAITWTDPASGVRCRALLDRVLEYPHCVVVIDLKTDRSTPTPKRWGDRAVDEWLYEQAEFYCRGARLAFNKPATFAWVVARNKAPLVAGFHTPDDEELAEARRTNNALLLRLAALMESSDEWRDEWSCVVNRVRPSERGKAILAARAAEAEEALKAA